MITEIIELLNKYKDRFIDESYFIELSEILMKYNNINQDEFNGIRFLNVDEAAERFNTSAISFEFTKAFYYEPEDLIYLLPSNITEDTKTWGYYDLTSQEHFIFSNLVRSVHMFHEFEHAVQKRGKTGLEGAVISSVSSAKDSSEYAISPREHFANLYSYLMSFSIAEEMNLPESILKHFKHSVESTLFNLYLYNEFDNQRNNKEINEPIVEYYNKINKPIDINLDYVNNFDFMSRIIFGFAISNDEFEHFHDLCVINNVEPDTILEQLDMYSKLENNSFRSVDTKVSIK